MIDKSLVKQRFSKAARTYNNESGVQANIASKLALALREMKLDKHGRLLEIGCGTGHLTQQIASWWEGELILNDLSRKMTEQIPAEILERGTLIIGDGEHIALEGQFNLIMSSSTIQWFNDLPAFFDRVYEALVPNGMVAFTTFGLNNMTEVSELTNQGLHYQSLKELLALLENKFEVLYAYEYEEVMHFDRALDVLRHLKYSGVNGTTEKMWTPTRLKQFCLDYEALNSSEEGVKLTYHPIIFIAKRKSE